MVQLGANEDLYFGVEDDETDSAADVSSWMAEREEQSRVILSAAIERQLRQRLVRAEQRLAYWDAERRAERFDDFKGPLRARADAERKVVDELRAQLARRLAGR